MRYIRILSKALKIAPVILLLSTMTLVLRGVILLLDKSASLCETTNNIWDLEYAKIGTGNRTVNFIQLLQDSYSQSNLSHSNLNQSNTNNTTQLFRNIRIPVRPILSTGSEDLNYAMHIDMPDLVRRVLSNLTIPIQPINDPQFTMLISNSDKCNAVMRLTGSPLELLILIKSAPGNFMHRDTIRLTWGNDMCWGGRQVLHLFLLGSVPSTNISLQNAINNESTVYGDIIQQDFVDHYYNNTYKVMFGIGWAVKFCSDVPVIMFVDDDFFVYPRNVVAYIEGLSRGLRKRLISGYVWHNAIPMRQKKKSKWFINWKEYPNSLYPPYVAAGNFFISMNIAQELNVAIRFTRYLRFDDVYIGILLRKLLRSPIHLSQVYAFVPVNESSNQIYSMLSSHNYGKPALQFALWSRLNCSEFCTPS